MTRKCECERYENKKNNVDDIWLNPKYRKQWAISSQVANIFYKVLVKGSTTILVKRSRTQAIGVRSGALTTLYVCDDDIVCARVERPRGYKSRHRSSVLFFIFQNN